MIKPETASTTALEKIAGEIGEFIGQGQAPPFFSDALHELNPDEGMPSYDLTDTFAVWVLDEEALSTKRTSSLSEMARFAERWHHQIRQGGEVAVYARSVGSDGSDLSFQQLAQSELARSIDQAISLVDTYEKELAGDWLVRLLIVPSYQAYAFWLVNQSSEKDSKVLLIEGAEQLSGVSRTEFFTDDRFVELLRRTRPVMGLSSAS
jgi:hypothetical protein